MKHLFNSVGVLVLLLLAFACYHVLKTPPPQPHFSHLPPVEQKRRRTEAQQLVEQIETVARRVRRREGGTWTITATGEQLNTLLQDRLRIQGFPIRDLNVGVEENQLFLGGVTQYKGFNVPVTLRGTLEASNGKLNFSIRSLTCVGAPIGGAWKAKAQTAITKGLSQALGHSGARFDSVTLEINKLTVRGHAVS